MNLRAKLFLAFVAVGTSAGLGVAAWPTYQRWRARAELERAASSFCSCMLGEKGVPIGEALIRARAGHLEEGRDDLYPQRCAPWGEQAVRAYREVWRRNYADLPPPPDETED